MPTTRGKCRGKDYEIFTPSEPDAGYKKMIILGYTHLYFHDLLGIIIKEFPGTQAIGVQIEVLPHRGLTFKG